MDLLLYVIYYLEQDDKLSWVPLRKRLGSEYKNMPLGTPLDCKYDKIVIFHYKFY